MSEISDIVDAWLEETADQWQAGCYYADMYMPVEAQRCFNKRKPPCLPGNLSYQDLINEVRSRIKKAHD